MDLAGYRPTLNEVAALLGKSSRWISDLRAQGEMPGDGATLKDFVGALVSYTAAKGASAGGKSIDSHKARLAAAKADQAEMKNAQLRGDLLPRVGVSHAVQGAFARVRAKLLAIPSKAAPIVVTIKVATAVQEKLTELVHEALAELAATEVQLAPEDVSGGGVPPGGVGRADDRVPELVAGDEPAAAADGEPVGGREPGTKLGRKRRTR